MRSRCMPGCVHAKPKRSQTRTPFHAGGGTGARQRNSSTGGAAYGMPRKRTIVPSSFGTPLTQPLSIVAFIEAPALASATRGLPKNVGCRERLVDDVIACARVDHGLHERRLERGAVDRTLHRRRDGRVEFRVFEQ